MAITLSHGGPTIYRSAEPSRQVLVGTIEGVVCLERDSGGGGWHVVHRTLTDKHVHALMIEPESGTIFAGMKHGSMFASGDGGRTWDHLGRGWTELPALRSVDTSRWSFPAPPGIAHTKHINFHPRDAQTLFIGVEQGGLLKSTDAGKTFQVIPGMDDDVHRTVINPLNPDRIYITTGIGMYVTGDGGKTWEQWTDLHHEIGGYPDLLVLHPRQPELMFVASAEKGPGSWRKSHFAGSRVSKSTDGGKTWQVLRQGLPDRLRPAFEAMCLEDWGDSFSVFAATATGEVWCSDDGGEHWSEVVTGLAPISKGDHYAAFVTA